MHSMHSMQNMGGGLCTVVYVFERYKENIQTYRLEYSFYAFYAKYGGGGISKRLALNIHSMHSMQIWGY